MNNDQLLMWIQAQVRRGHFVFTEHALTKHPVDEQFTANDSITALLAGSIIQHREDQARCVICGEARDIVTNIRFHGTWIHCVVQYDQVTEMIVITMYRPTRVLWATPFSRASR